MEAKTMAMERLDRCVNEAGTRIGRAGLWTDGLEVRHALLNDVWTRALNEEWPGK